MGGVRGSMGKRPAAATSCLCGSAWWVLHMPVLAGCCQLLPDACCQLPAAVVIAHRV